MRRCWRLHGRRLAFPAIIALAARDEDAKGCGRRTQLLDAGRLDGRAAWWLRPLRNHLLDTLRRSGKLFADEIVAPVLDPGKGHTKRGQLWAYARDDRPLGGSDPRAVAYRYAPDRKAEQPIEHLAGFRGVLQIDGYTAYGKLTRIGDVQLALCWARLFTDQEKLVRKHQGRKHDTFSCKSNPFEILSTKGKLDPWGPFITYL